MKIWQENKIPLSIILAGLIIGAFIYLSSSNKAPETLTKAQPFPAPSSTPTPVSTTEEPVPSPAEEPTPIPRPKVDQEKVKADLLAKTSISPENFIFSIGETLNGEDRVLIRGTVKEAGAVGGAGFFGYCDLSICQVTYVGQGVPLCSEVNPYDYPVSWADYCTTVLGATVRR